MILFFKKKPSGKLSKNSYYRYIFFGWIYTIAWWFGIYAIYELWNVPWYYKILPFTILIICVPDIRSLFESYSTYKKEIKRLSGENEKDEEK